MTSQNNGRPPKSLSVRILDKEYHIACPPGAESELLLSAQYLDKQMKSIRRTGKVVGLERIAVMAGLNTSYELLKATRRITTLPAETEIPETTQATSPLLVNEKLTELKNRIDEALSANPFSTTTAAPSAISVPTPTQVTREATHESSQSRDIDSFLWPEDEKTSLQVSALEVEY